LDRAGLHRWRVLTVVDEPLLTVRVERRFSLTVPLIGEIGLTPISAHVTMYYEALG
jgi:hypothetical protein